METYACPTLELNMAPLKMLGNWLLKCHMDPAWQLEPTFRWHPLFGQLLLRAKTTKHLLFCLRQKDPLGCYLKAALTTQHTTLWPSPHPKVWPLLHGGKARQHAKLGLVCIRSKTLLGLLT